MNTDQDRSLTIPSLCIQEVNSRQYYDQSPEAHPKAYGGLEVCTGSGVEGGDMGTIMAQPILNTANTETLLTVEPKVSYMSHDLWWVNVDSRDVTIH